MKSRRIVFSTLAIFLLMGVGFYFNNSQETSIEPSPNPSININQDARQADGFGTDSARVDSQITLKIPEGKSSEVYAYLVKTYVENKDLLKKEFPALNLQAQQRTDISNFTDNYFDTPNLDLMKSQNSARHRLRINTTDPTDAKSGKELVQIKVTPAGQFDMRSEIKFEVKHKKRDGTLDDLHPLISLIKTDQRSDFKKALQNMNLDPYSLRYILTNQQKRSRVYIDLDNINILSFSVDEGSAKFWWAEAKISSVDIGLVETEYTAASLEKRKQMESIQDFLIKDLREHFPEMEISSEEKYALLLKQLIEKVPFVPFIIKYKLI